jgi:hypothetical protein
MSVNTIQPQVFSESVTNTSTTLARGIELGTEQWYNGAKYKLVYQIGTLTTVAGSPVFQAATTSHYVQASATNTLTPWAAGVAISAASTGTYHWILSKGFYASCVASGTFLTGSIGAPSGTGGGGCYLMSGTSSMTASSVVQQPFLVAMSGSSGGLVPGIINGFGS